MAVYTHVDDHMLADLLARYDLGSPTCFKGIAEGVSNSNFYLETDKDRFILTLYEYRAEESELPYFLDLMEHLAKKGVPSPLPVRDKNGESLQKVAGRPACLITFLTGVSLNHFTVDHCKEVGYALADIHDALSDFGATRENALSLAGWQEIADKTRDRADEIEPGLSKKIDSELEFLKKSWPTDLPKGTIHADLFPDNVLFTGDTLTGMIDFYFACTDFLAYDLAVCINAWCFDENHDFQSDKAYALVRAYKRRNPMKDAELKALAILCRGAAMRFLVTRVEDWLSPIDGAVVQAKDPLEYLKKLQFFQQTGDIFQDV